MTDKTDPTAPAPDGQVYRNGVIAVVIAWSMRVIGLVSVFVLARTLTPADFGIVALAMTTLAMVDVFASIGLRQALLRVERPERSHYDTVWTIQLGILIVLALVVTALAPVMAWFYAEPALTLVVAVLSTRFVFFGLANIGIIDFERDLELGRDLKFRLIVRLTTFVVTIAAALVLRNYWALVIGAVMQGMVHCLASYAVHPYRPNFSTKRRAEMLGVSLWMFLASLAQVIHTESQRIVVGRIASMGVLGFYSVSKGLSSIFTEEIATALNRVTFVTTARTRKDLGAEPARLRAMLSTYAMIAAPLGIGLAATAPYAVRVLLGEQWIEAAPFLALIAPAAALYAVFKLIVSSLQASGKARLAAGFAIASALGVLAAMLTALGMGGGAIEIAGGVLVANGAALLVALMVLAHAEKTSALGLLSSAARPFIAAGIMFASITALTPPASPAILVLTGQAALGAAVYAIALGAIWLVSGRPDGAEANAGTLVSKTARQIWRGKGRAVVSAREGQN
ncbi:oligosaccharide flippase family protein [Qipengyuania nanhaisediminis]|uniref:oligosaccharide flippase family protein n=1 Tax=Qipengyuania nanhaisediminis TaxID=604088 RepID=UPI0038B2552F